MKKRFVLLLLLFAIGGIGGCEYPVSSIDRKTHEIQEFKVPGKLAPFYVSIANDYHVPWFYLAAIDEVQTKYIGVNQEKMKINARKLSKLLGQRESTPQNMRDALSQVYSDNHVNQMMKIADSYEWEAATLSAPYPFPLGRQKVSYIDSWGFPRTYGGKRKHEGADLMTSKGNSLVSVADGEVVKKGWDRLGGWCLFIQDRRHPHLYYYYAHLSKHAGGLDEGTRVQQGELIGYVGNSGYGPEGTTGQFPPHLHFSIYIQEGSLFQAINPYPFLKVWQTRNEDQ